MSSAKGSAARFGISDVDGCQPRYQPSWVDLSSRNGSTESYAAILLLGVSPQTNWSPENARKHLSAL